VGQPREHGVEAVVALDVQPRLRPLHIKCKWAHCSDWRL
jgi:hypothetical protein